MHVLILASAAGSLVNFRGPLIADLVARGHQVSVSAPELDAALCAQLSALGATPYPVALERNSTSFGADLGYLRSLRALIKDLRPGLVLTYTIKPNIWGAFAARSCGVPSVAMVTGLGYMFTDTGTRPSAKARAVRFVVRRLYRAATWCNRKVIFQNPDDVQDFRAAGALARRTPVGLVNGSGVDLTHYPPAPLPPAPVFVMIARLLHNKGVREYAAASIELRKEFPQARCVLAGPFDGGPDSISQAELDEWIAAGLDYVGPLEDVRPTLAEARVFVLPSYREGTPRSVLEAMATGRAIITSDAPGCRETVTDGVNGFLVPLRDAKALNRKMRWCVQNPEATARMAQDSLAIVRDKYDVTKVNAALIDHLEI